MLHNEVTTTSFQRESTKTEIKCPWRRWLGRVGLQSELPSPQLTPWIDNFCSKRSLNHFHFRLRHLQQKTYDSTV